MRSRWRLILVCATVLALGLSVAVKIQYDRIRHRLAPTEYEPRPFEAEGWASGSATLRHEMARHMEESGELLGKSKAEIVALLDEPLPGKDGRRMEWSIGKRKSAASMMWDYDGYFVVVLDEQDRCQKAYAFDRD